MENIVLEKRITAGHIESKQKIASDPNQHTFCPYLIFGKIVVLS